MLTIEQRSPYSELARRIAKAELIKARAEEARAKVTPLPAAWKRPYGSSVSTQHPSSR